MAVAPVCVCVLGGWQLCLCVWRGSTLLTEWEEQGGWGGGGGCEELYERACLSVCVCVLILEGCMRTLVIKRERERWGRAAVDVSLKQSRGLASVASTPTPPPSHATLPRQPPLLFESSNHPLRCAQSGGSCCRRGSATGRARSSTPSPRRARSSGGGPWPTSRASWRGRRRMRCVCVFGGGGSAGISGICGGRAGSAREQEDEVCVRACVWIWVGCTTATTVPTHPP